MIPRPDPARPAGLRRTALVGLKQGLPVAVLVTPLTLLLGEDASFYVWGATLILGPTFLLIGVAFWALLRGYMRYDARLHGDAVVQDPWPSALHTERICVRLGLALTLTWLVLSAVLLLRGETLF